MPDLPNALIGHTGFVGGNLVRQREFQAFYNSKNIEEMAHKHFGTVVCAGAPAVKWWANQNPEADRKNLKRLMNTLETIQVERFILISTVDVYRDPVGVDEDTPIETESLHPYGKHRHALETLVRESFRSSHIVRLPGLFGAGLKKNILYDFIHDNQVEKIDSRGVFQFYDLAQLSRQLDQVVTHRLPLVNFATQPVSVADIAREVFGRSGFEQHVLDSPATYDMKTRYADIMGGKNGYLFSREDVLTQIRAYVSSLQPAR